MGREVVVAVTNGRLDFGTWERILRVSWMADTGVSTAGGGNGYWSRLSASRCAQGYADIYGRARYYRYLYVHPVVWMAFAVI